MPDRPRVLLDANVLWSSQLRNLILQMAIDEVLSARWSREIESEWLRNTDDELRCRLESRTLPVLRKNFPDAWVEGFDVPESVGKTDAKDVHVAAAAATMAPCDLLTLNVRDFDQEHLDKMGVRVMTPDALLSNLVDAGRDLIIDVTKRAHANLTKSAPTWDAYLEILRAKCGLVGFVERISRYSRSEEADEGNITAIEALSRQSGSDEPSP
jgi:hypothetical protein